MSGIADRPPCQTIHPATAAVWFTNTDAVTSPNVLIEYERLLDRAERRRYESFRFPADRHLYLVAHALLRTTLSRYADTAPADWQFTNEEGQRPELLECPEAASRLRFSLSHTSGLAACVVARDADIGIDVEKVNRRIDATSISDRYFSAHEAQQVAALSGDARQQRFLEYWTLKEAYLKACGVGLSIPLNDFHFDRDAAEDWQINFSTGANSTEKAWQFRSTRPTPHHIMSVAVLRPDGIPFEVTIRETLPLCEPPDSTARHHDI